MTASPLTEAQRLHECRADLFLQLNEKTYPLNLARIRVLLKAGVDINTPLGAGSTFLTYALCSKKNEPAIPLLLAAGADANQKARGLTPLWNCISYNYEKTLRLLLAYGADPERTSNENPPLNALNCALMGRKEWAIPILLAAGASIRVPLVTGSEEIHKHETEWQPRYEKFLKNEFTPQTPADWLGLASVMPLSDPQAAYSSVADRVAQLMDWHKGLKAVRAQAASPTIGGLGV